MAVLCTDWKERFRFDGAQCHLRAPIPMYVYAQRHYALHVKQPDGVHALSRVVLQPLHVTFTTTHRDAHSFSPLNSLVLHPTACNNLHVAAQLNFRDLGSSPHTAPLFPAAVTAGFVKHQLAVPQHPQQLHFFLLFFLPAGTSTIAQNCIGGVLFLPSATLSLGRLSTWHREA